MEKVLVLGCCCCCISTWIFSSALEMNFILWFFLCSSAGWVLLQLNRNGWRKCMSWCAAAGAASVVLWCSSINTWLFDIRSISISQLIFSFFEVLTACFWRVNELLLSRTLFSSLDDGHHACVCSVGCFGYLSLCLLLVNTLIYTYFSFGPLPSVFWMQAFTAAI